MEKPWEKEVSPDGAKLKSILNNYKRQTGIFEFEESTIGSFFQEICGFVFDEPDIPLAENLSSSCGYIFQNGDLIYRCAYTDVVVAFYLILIEIAHMIQPAFFVLVVFRIMIILIIRYLSTSAKDLVAVVIVVKMNRGRTL
jgi:hypothetical protein